MEGIPSLGRCTAHQPDAWVLHSYSCALGADAIFRRLCSTGFAVLHPLSFRSLFHELVAEAKALWPNVKLIMPQQEFDLQFVLAGDEVLFSDGDITLRFLRLPHEGSAFASVPHYGLLLSDGVFRILIAGDCEIASPALSQHLEHTTVDLAILDFPWLTLNKGRRYVEDVLRPRHLLLYHLPFPEDDVNGYLSAVRHAAELSSLTDIRLLCNPLQQEAI